MGIDKSFEQAFLKAQLATGVKLPQRGTAFVSVKNQDKNKKLNCIGSQIIMKNKEVRLCLYQQGLGQRVLKIKILLK